MKRSLCIFWSLAMSLGMAGRLGAVCAPVMFNPVETLSDNGTWSGSGAAQGLVTSTACVTFGSNALQSDILSAGVPQDNLFRLSGFSPSDWGNVTDILFDFYVDPARSPFTSWGAVQVLATDSGAGMIDQPVTLTFTVSPGMNNVSLPLDWSQGSLGPGNTINNISLRLDGDNLPGTGRLCVDRIMLVFDCLTRTPTPTTTPTPSPVFTPTISATPTPSFSHSPTHSPTPTPGLPSPTPSPTNVPCPPVMFNPVETLSDNGTWSSPGAAAGIVNGGACVTFGANAYQVALPNSPLPQDNVMLLSGFSPSSWTFVTTIFFDYYVDPADSPFTSWGTVRVLASDIGAGLNDEPITAAFPLATGMNNVGLTIDWSQGALTAASTINQLSFSFDGDGSPGSGTVCIDRLMLSFDCLTRTPTPTASPSPSPVYTPTASPSAGMTTPTATLTVGPPSWNADKQLDDFDDVSPVYSAFVPGAAGTGLTLTVDTVDYAEGAESARVDYTFNAVPGGFVELLRGYGTNTLDLSFNPVGLALWIKGAGGALGDSVRLMLYEDNDRDGDPYEAGEEVWASTPRSIGSSWNQAVWSYAEFSVFAGGGDAALNLDRIYAWRLVVDNGPGSAHGGQVWVDDLRQLTSYVPPATGSDIVDASFIQIWNTGSGVGCECGQWTGTQWFDEFRKLRDMCHDRVIIQYSVYEPAGDPSQTTAWYPFTAESQIEYTNSTLATIFAAADTYGINVVLGLYFRDDWASADKASTSTYSNLGAWQSVVINELAGLYGSNPNFAGWYIPQEANDLEFEVGSLASVRLADYYQNVANLAATATTPSRPIYFSPYFGGNMPADELAQWYTDLLTAAPSLNIVLLQDGVGTHRTDGDVDVPHYYAAVKAAVEAQGKGFAAVVENFDQTDGWPVGPGPFAAQPTDIGTFTSQLWQAGLFTPLLVQFEYPYMLSSRGAAYDQLYQDYKAYHIPIEDCAPTPTATISPTFTHSPTITGTATQSPAYSATDTPTISPTHTITPTHSVTPSHTHSPTLTPSFSVSPTFSHSPTASETPTASWTPTVTETFSQTVSATVSPSETITATPSLTSTPTDSPTQSPTLTVSWTSTPTATLSPTVSATQTPSASQTVSPSHTETVSPTESASATPSHTPTRSVTFSVTPTLLGTLTASPTSSETLSPTPTLTDTPTPAASGTATPSPAWSATSTWSVTPSATPSLVVTATPSFSPDPGDGLPDVAEALAAPHPLGGAGGSMFVKLEAAGDLLEIELFSTGWTKVAHWELSNPQRGWNRVNVGPDLLGNLANGLYYFEAAASKSGKEGRRGLGYLYLAR